MDEQKIGSVTRRVLAKAIARRILAKRKEKAAAESRATPDAQSQGSKEAEPAQKPSEAKESGRKKPDCAHTERDDVSQQ